MRKKLILPLLFLLSFFIPAFSQTYISEIKIKGNKVVSEEKILSLMKTKVGAEFNEGVIREDVRRIGESGYFSNVSYEYKREGEKVILEIIVKEKPVIEEIYFSGNKVFSRKKLLKFIGISKGEIFNEVKLRDGIEEIKRNYLKKGVNFVEINYETKEVDGKVNIYVKIDEKGGRSYIEKIVFKGNKSFSKRKLAKLIKLKRRRMPIFKGTFKQETFQRDIENIQRFYRKNGFLDVVVNGKIVPVRRGRILIEFNIKEGQKYFLGDIDFKGEKLLFDKNKLFSVLVLKKKGEVFDEEKAYENIKNLTELYYNRGYIRAQISSIPFKNGKYINIVYYINPGDVYYAGEIKIKGNTKTKDKVIRRELKVYPGDIITSKKIKKSYMNLKNLNYFDEIKILPEFAEKENEADIVVDVKEKEKTGLFLIGGGYSSVDNIVGMVSIQQNNFDITNPPHFVGAGQHVSLTTEIGTEAQNFSLSFTEPYFLDKPIWFGTDIFRLRHEWDDYTIRNTGGDIRAGKRWENFSFGVKILSEKNELSDIDIPSLQHQEGSYRKNSITFSYIFNNLGSRFSPEKGDKLNFDVEYAGGILQGDIDFIKPTIENNFYYPLKKWIFHSRTYAGWIKEIGDTDEIPVNERFFGGGIGTVRGYDERSLSPKDSAGNRVGGKVIFAQNLEMVYPLYKDILKGVLFFDIGNVWDKWKFSDLKKGVGAGIRVVIPMFNAPVEIYYGYALDKEEGESRGQIHIGMSFGF